MSGRIATAALCAAAALAAVPARRASAAPWDATLDFATVSPQGDAILAGQKPVRFVCADLADGVPADEAAAVALAGELWAAGVDLVRLSGLAAPEAPDAPERASDVPANAFVGACRALGTRVWAEVLAPAAEVPVSASEAALVDDPSTADAWTNAVSEALSEPGGASRLFLAAAWDPRLEVALQRRVRGWGRAFNPRTGLRRCEDPVFAVFSFSFPWLDLMAAPDRAPLPAFFEASLREWWGNWLFDRFGSDEKAEAALGPFLPGETVVSNTVAFPPLDPADAGRTSAFRAEQRLFLRKLDLEHLRRVVAPFSLLGPSARLAPRLVSNSAGRAVSALSGVSLGGSAAFRGGAADNRPLVWTCGGGGLLAEARAAAEAGASVFSVPVAGAGLDGLADAAAVFRAGGAPGGVPSGAGGLDYPFYARGAGECRMPEGTNLVAAVAAFPAFGAQIRFVAGDGGDARKALEGTVAASNAAPMQIVVHLGAAKSGSGRFLWSFRARRDEASGALPVAVSLRDAETGAPAAFGFLSAGQVFSRKSMFDGTGSVPSAAAGAGEAPVPAARLPENGVFRTAVPDGRALLTFRSTIVAPAALLRAVP